MSYTRPKLAFHVFRSPKNGHYYFHLKSRNGKIVIQSEGYKTKAARLKTIMLLRFHTEPAGYHEKSAN